MPIPFKASMHRSLTIDEATLVEFCDRHQIKRLSLFGSQLKGTVGSGSDIDLLVEFEPDATPTLFDLVAMEQELSTLLGGQRVDLRTPGDLSRYFRSEVLRNAEVQFAR